MSHSLWPHELQHARLLCPSLSPRVCSELMSIESVMPSNHLILCHPLLLLPSIFTSIWVFSNESALHIRWPKYWSFSFSISPSNEYSGLISFRIDYFDLLAALPICVTQSAPRIKASMVFPRVFPTGLSHEAFPQGCPGESVLVSNAGMHLRFPPER